MRRDIAQEVGEEFVEWMRRLHSMVQQAPSVSEADWEIITVIVNNLPKLCGKASMK